MSVYFVVKVCESCSCFSTELSFFVVEFLFQYQVPMYCTSSKSLFSPLSCLFLFRKPRVPEYGPSENLNAISFALKDGSGVASYNSLEPSCVPSPVVGHLAFLIVWKFARNFESLGYLPKKYWS